MPTSNLSDYDQICSQQHNISVICRMLLKIADTKNVIVLTKVCTDHYRNTVIYSHSVLVWN